MQNTKKYNFNLIETSDTFSPDKLNENTQKVEDQLAALENTHAADKAALEATQNAQAAAMKLRNCQFYRSDYAGTGKKGARTITFPRKPIFVYIASDRWTWAGGVWGCQTFMGVQPSNSINTAPLLWTDNSLTIGDSSTSVDEAFNNASRTYHQFAILELEE